MSEDNPYMLVNDIYDLLSELKNDLRNEFWDKEIQFCKEDIVKINQKIKRIGNWITKKEIQNKE